LTRRTENKGNTIVKLDSIRSSLTGSVFAIATSLLLGSCGGGGAGSPGPIGGPPQIQPSTGTLYAGVEYTITIAGGRPPYTVSSSEPALLSVPTVLDGNFFTVIPANPGVIDAGLPPGSVPTRSVTITMRDSVGSTAATSGLSVAQNFFTGYGVFFSSNCASAAGGAAPAACAGGETAVEVSATINGNLYGNREYRFEILRGPISWFFPNNQTQGGTISGNTVTTRTDHEGDAHVWFRVANNVATQIAAIRVVDVATGASTVHVFTIGGTPINGVLEAIPEEFTFTGINSAQCGTGFADFLVFDGIPPYTATSTSPNLTVFRTGDLPPFPTTITSNSQPGRFTLQATNPNVCLADVPIIITDVNNNRTTVTVTTEPGSAPPPPTPVSVTPGSLTLNCGQSGSVSVLGGPTGTASFSVSSPDPRVSATASGRTVTVTRAAADVPTVPPTPPGTISYIVTVTDGATSTTIGISAPAVCP
jgi:hypothetical protein